MKLSRLYTNNDKVFSPIGFHQGLNTILAKIQHPTDEEKSSHCLGKTLLIDVIDFCLLKSVGSKGHFLKTREDLFGDLIFFLEIELNRGGYVTIRRPVKDATAISFKRHPERHQAFHSLSDGEWDHVNLSLSAGVRMLDSYLGLSVIKPWSYRKGVSYFMRRQEDYGNEFQLRKFMSGNHKDWKPYVAKVLGFDDAILVNKYEADKEISQLSLRKAELQREVTVKLSDYEKLKASIVVKRDEVDQKSSALDAFDFHAQEIGLNKQVVEELEVQIADLNESLYNAQFDLSQVRRSLEDSIQFDLNEIQRIFDEARITFPEQLAKEYDDLVEFNRRIFTERQSSLKKRAEELEEQVQEYVRNLALISLQRKEVLGILGGSDSLVKFKNLQKELDRDRASLVVMEEKADRLDAIRALDDELRSTKSKCDELTETIKELVDSGADRYVAIQKTFSRLIREILHRSAVLYVQQNDSGNLDFHAEYTDLDSDTETQERRGTTFRKILCIAFDLAVLINYADEKFFHFVYHDGALEQLESKRKLALLSSVRAICSEHNIQYIFSALEEEIPYAEDIEHLCPTSEEVILELHDGGNEGRLFKVDRF